MEIARKLLEEENNSFSQNLITNRKIWIEKGVIGCDELKTMIKMKKRKSHTFDEC